MHWYELSNNILKVKYGQNAELMADIIASTSPRKTVTANIKLAEKIYNCYITGKNWYNIIGLLPNHKPNIIRALKRQQLSGNKVLAFSENIKGNYNRVTIDTWILRYYKIKDKTLTEKQYSLLEKKIIKSAKQKKMLPAEYQAYIWFKVRKNNYQNQNSLFN